MSKEAADRLATKAAAKLAGISMTGHSKQANGLLTRFLQGAAARAPAVERFMGDKARRFGTFFGNQLRNKPKRTLFLSGLGLGGASDLAAAAGLPGAGQWDPAAHAEKIDPRVTGWQAAGHTYARPLQTLLAWAGLAGKKDPVTFRPGGRPLGSPTNIRFGPGGQAVGTLQSDVDLELSPRMQSALEALQQGTDPLSQLRQGFAAGGMTDVQLPGQPAKPPRLPAYADPNFLNNRGASPTAANFARSF